MLNITQKKRIKIMGVIVTTFILLVILIVSIISSQNQNTHLIKSTRSTNNNLNNKLNQNISLRTKPNIIRHYCGDTTDYLYYYFNMNNQTPNLPVNFIFRPEYCQFTYPKTDNNIVKKLNKYILEDINKSCIKKMMSLDHAISSVYAKKQENITIKNKTVIALLKTYSDNSINLMGIKNNLIISSIYFNKLYNLPQSIKNKSKHKPIFVSLNLFKNSTDEDFHIKINKIVNCKLNNEVKNKNSVKNQLNYESNPLNLTTKRDRIGINITAISNLGVYYSMFFIKPFNRMDSYYLNSRISWKEYNNLTNLIKKINLSNKNITLPKNVKLIEKALEKRLNKRCISKIKAFDNWNDNYNNQTYVGILYNTFNGIFGNSGNLLLTEDNLHPTDIIPPTIYGFKTIKQIYFVNKINNLKLYNNRSVFVSTQKKWIPKKQVLVEFKINKIKPKIYKVTFLRRVNCYGNSLLNRPIENFSYSSGDFINSIQSMNNISNLFVLAQGVLHYKLFDFYNMSINNTIISFENKVSLKINKKCRKLMNKFDNAIDSHSIYNKTFIAYDYQKDSMLNPMTHGNYIYGYFYKLYFLIGFKNKLLILKKGSYTPSHTVGEDVEDKYINKKYVDFPNVINDAFHFIKFKIIKKGNQTSIVNSSIVNCTVK